jgi:hypothetical protein
LCDTITTFWGEAKSDLSFSISRVENFTDGESAELYAQLKK